MIFFRDSDRVAICGDVIRNITYVTMRTKLAEPPDELTPDPAENRRSIRKLAALNPSLILPGHGPRRDRHRRPSSASPPRFPGSPTAPTRPQAGYRVWVLGHDWKGVQDEERF